MLLLLLTACRVDPTDSTPAPAADDTAETADTADTADTATEDTDDSGLPGGTWSPGTATQVYTADRFAGFILSTWMVDADGDGDVDLVAAVRDTAKPEGQWLSVVLLPGDGAGAFGAPSLASGDDSTTNSFGADLGDVDGDGLPDVVVATTHGFGVNFGGSGGFGEQVGVDLGWSDAYSALAADVDGDGMDEVVVSGNSSAMGEVSVYRFDRTRTATRGADWIGTDVQLGTTPSDVVVYRGAGGARSGLVAGLRDLASGAERALQEADGGTLSLALVHARLTDDGFYGGAAVDLDDDGVDEVVTEGGAGLELYRPLDDTGEMLHARGRITAATWVTTGDLDGDGRDDLLESVVDYSDTTKPAALQLSSLLRTDSGFGDVVDVSMDLEACQTPAASVAIGDVDGDGCGDVTVITGAYQDGLALLRGECE